MSQVMVERGLAGFELAYQIDGGQDALGRCGFLFLGGFKSDMTGKKAEALAGLARETRRRSLRFDYSGHGQSSGAFTDGTISAWLEQALHMYLTHTKSKVIVVGSSMGGWLAMLLARRLRAEDGFGFRRLGGLVLLAPATDMTQELMWNRFDDKAKAQLRDKGLYLEPSQYGAPYEITARLLADGLQHCFLNEGLQLPFPVRIIQGDQDPDVPPAHALRTFEALSGPDITLSLIKGGDHRLSSPGQLRLITEAALNLAERADGV